MEFEHIIVEIRDNIEFITLNRPQVMNALNIDTVSELREAVELAGSSEEVKVVIITGAGDRAFAAGADISEMRDLTPAGGRDMIANGQALMLEIEALEKPVIAALNGYTIGGGFELALACDIRIAAEKVQFSFPEPTLGIIPGYGGTQRLLRIIGRGPTMYYCMSEERITAQRAYELGLVAKVVPAEELMDECLKLAAGFLRKSVAANAALKRVIRAGAEVDLAAGLKIESREFDRLFSSPDRVTRMTAFLENQKAKKRK